MYQDGHHDKLTLVCTYASVCTVLRIHSRIFLELTSGRVTAATMRSVAASVVAMLQCTVLIAGSGTVGRLYSGCPAWSGYLSAVDRGGRKQRVMEVRRSVSGSRKVVAKWTQRIVPSTVQLGAFRLP